MSNDLEQGRGVQHPLVLINAMIERGSDPDALKKMMDMVIIWKENEAREQFNVAMSACQAEMPLLTRRKENQQTHSRYTPYEDLNAITRPIYVKHGFSLTWTEGEPKENGEVHLICDVRHSAGHVMRRDGYFGLDSAGFKGAPNKTPVQAKGSTYSYGRRYMEKFIWNLAEADEDKDGAGPTIGPESVKEIADLLKECEDAGNKVDHVKFLQWLNVESVEQLSYPKAEQARVWLRMKKTQKKSPEKKGAKV